MTSLVCNKLKHGLCPSLTNPCLISQDMKGIEEMGKKDKTTSNKINI